MICRGRHGAVRLRRRATWLDDDSTRDTGRRLREFGRLQEVSFEGTHWVPFFKTIRRIQKIRAQRKFGCGHLPSPQQRPGQRPGLTKFGDTTGQPKRPSTQRGLCARGGIGANRGMENDGGQPPDRLHTPVSKLARPPGRSPNEHGPPRFKYLPAECGVCD